MTKAEVVMELQSIIGEEKVTKTDCTRIWDAIVDMIVEEVKKDGEIKFGSYFKVFKKYKNERVARNPKTGESFKIPAHYELGTKVMSAGKKLFK